MSTITETSILTIDIGGSHIKGTILSAEGATKQEYTKLLTPQPGTPEAVVKTIHELIKGFPAFDKISVGFPGYVRNGVVFTAPNLGAEYWNKVELGQMLSDELGKPLRLVNDADQLGLGIASGKGYELVATLGTGFGTALLIDGYLLPHLELAHHPVSKDRDYDAYIGKKALDEVGEEKWNKRIAKVVEVLKTVFNYDRLYLGGGNADEVKIPLDDNIHVVTNRDGIKGGAKLWQMEERYHISTNYPSGKKLKKK